MKEYLQNKNIEISLKRYGIDALNAMALGLFGSLIVGLILKSIGQWFEFEFLIEVGIFAQSMMGAAIGAAVSFALQSPILVMVSNIVIGAFGAKLGGPVGCFLSVLFATELGKLISKTTPIDIILTPIFTLSIGLIFARWLGEPIQQMMQAISQFISWAMELQPILMGIVIAVVMGILLTTPVSSAAIAISLSLSGTVAGAATVGCCAQMIGFAVMSARDNNLGGIISQGIGTSMLQMPNIIKNPKIWIPPILASAILGPVATSIFGMLNVPAGAGMGTSGLVGQIGTIEAMGNSSKVYLSILILHFISPAILTYIFYKILIKIGWVKSGDLRLSN